MNGEGISNKGIDDIDFELEIVSEDFDILSTLIHHFLSAAEFEILALNNVEEPRVEDHIISGFQDF